MSHTETQSYINGSGTQPFLILFFSHQVNVGPDTILYDTIITDLNKVKMYSLPKIRQIKKPVLCTYNLYNGKGKYV